MRRTLRLLALGTLCLLTNGATAQTSLVGTYTVEGTNPDATTYTGHAEVIETDDGIGITLTNEAGEVMGMAIGLREGNVISTVFQTSDGAIGVAAYRIEGDQLIGHWRVPGLDGVFTETLTKADPRLHGATGPKNII